MAISHKFLSVVNRTSTNAISTSDVDPFVPSNHTSPVIEYVNDAQSSVTYNSSTGGITIGTGDFYHIAFSVYLSVDPSNTLNDRIVTIKFKKNGTTISTSTTKIETGFHTVSTERTFTYFGQFSDNDILQATVVSDGGTDIYITKGTSLTVLGGLTSFGNATRISGIVEQLSGQEANPFINGVLATNYILNTSADFTTSGSAFKYTGATTGLYMSYANFLPTTSTLTGGQITFRLKKNGTTNYSNITALTATSNPNNKPYESSLIGLQSLATNDTIESTATPNASTIYHIASSSLSVVGINDEEYISIKTNQASSNVLNNNPLIMFKNTSYSSFTAPTQLVPTTGVTYNTGSGTFTVSSGGYYYIASNMILQSVSGSTDHLTASFSLRKNATSCSDGTQIWDAITKVDAQEDPVERTITGIFQLAANDSVLLCLNAQSTPGVLANINCSFTMFRVGGLPSSGGGGLKPVTFGAGSSGFSVGSFSSPVSGRTVINGFY